MLKKNLLERFKLLLSSIVWFNIVCLLMSLVLCHETLVAYHFCTRLTKDVPFDSLMGLTKARFDLILRDVLLHDFRDLEQLKETVPSDVFLAIGTLFGILVEVVIHALLAEHSGT